MSVISSNPWTEHGVRGVAGVWKKALFGWEYKVTCEQTRCSQVVNMPKLKTRRKAVTLRVPRIIMEKIRLLAAQRGVTSEDLMNDFLARAADAESRSNSAGAQGDGATSSVTTAAKGGVRRALRLLDRLDRLDARPPAAAGGKALPATDEAPETRIRELTPAYARKEYGLTRRELEAAGARVAAEVAAERKAGLLRPWPDKRSRKAGRRSPA